LFKIKLKQTQSLILHL